MRPLAKRVKSLRHIQADLSAEHTHRLNRTLGSLDLISLGIGAVVGTGIFAVIGTAAAGGPGHPGAGPAVALSFVLTALVCTLCAFSYAEFASLVPISGSAYTYAYATLGEWMAWIIGWDLIIEYAVGNVAVAISWAAYCKQLLDGFQIPFPAWLAVDYRTAYQAGQAALAQGGQAPESMALAYQAWTLHPTFLGIPLIFNLLAVLIVMLVTWLLYIGIKESARANNIMVALKLAILMLFVGVGVFHVKPENWTPFMPNGFNGVWAGASLVFFAFIGFDAISTAAEESRNPRRDLPIGIIGSLVVCTLIYVAIAVVLTGMWPSRDLGVGDPLAFVFSKLGMNWMAGLISLGAVISMTAVLLVFQLGQSRIFFSMSRDGLLPPGLAKVHPRYKTPHRVTLWTGIVVALVSAVANLNEIVELVNVGTLFAFVLVNAGIIVLRYTQPDQPRPFRTPWVPFLPLLGIGMCLYLMLGLPPLAWKRFGLWLAIGMIFYFFYGYRHSRLANASKLWT